MNRENAPKPNAECVICGNKYYRCARCIELKNRGIEAWKLHCDTMECFAVHTLIENARKGNFDANMLGELNAIKLIDDREFKAEIVAEIEKLNGAFSQEDTPKEDTEIRLVDDMAVAKKSNKRTRNQSKAKNVK